VTRFRWSTAGWAATLLVTTLLVGCANYEAHDVNTWLKVRIRRPVNAGIFHVGPATHVWGYVKINWRWQVIGEGTGASVLRLANDRAALLTFFDGMREELFLLRADDPRPTRMRDLLPRDGVLSVPPTGQRVDCVVGEGLSVGKGYRRLVLSSLDLDGHVSATRTVDAPDVDGQPGRFISADVMYYNGSATPYFQVIPVGGDWHGPWLLTGVFPEGLRSVRSPEGSRPDTSDWRRLTGEQLFQPKKFYDFPYCRPCPIPP
jgi:hypothetical protein